MFQRVFGSTAKALISFCGSSRRRASVGVISNPPSPVRCTLLRKPTKGVNSSGRHGVLSTEFGLGPSSLPNDKRAGTGWNDKDFQLLIPRKLSCGSLRHRLVAKETEHRCAAAGQKGQ